MDPERARELLQAGAERIERGLAQAAHEDDGEEADDQDPGNLASDLYQDEFDEGLRDDLGAQLAAVERAEARLGCGGPTACRCGAGSRSPTSGWKSCPPPS